jgi:hypothetical protein
MYEGYLEIGGNEVINSARAVGYMETSHCSVSWLRCAPCQGIEDVVNEGNPFVIANIADAPWYDPRSPQSARFLGVHGLDVEGLPGSTREADVVEGIADGGVIGQVRHATRRMRVRAVLSAQGQDALEYGLAWLDSVLQAGHCHMHSDSCGKADSRFFLACPPTRSSVVASSVVWNDPVTNLMINPSFEGPMVPTGVNLLSEIATDWQSSGPKSLRQTPNTASNDSYSEPFADVGSLPLQPGTVYTLSAKVRLTVPITGAESANGARSLFVRLNGEDLVTKSTPGAQAPNTGGVHEVRVRFTTPLSLVGENLIRFYHGGAAGSGQVWWDDVMLVQGDYSGPYFDGSLPDSPPTSYEGALVHEYEWAGEPHASMSTYRTGNVVNVPDPVLWNDMATRLIRNMHGVTCVGGPTIEEKLHRGNAWGYIVEFILVAANPYLFSNIMHVDLEPSYPVVIQDVPFNLVPYPSAELALGTVVIATNYATNPSLEVNADTWVTWYNANIPQGFKSTTRTADVSAVGSWAYEARIAGDGGATPANAVASDITILQNSMALEGVAGTRYSFSIWAAALKIAGGAGTSLINMSAAVQWVNGADAIVGSTPLGAPVAAAAMSGSVFEGKSFLPPAGAVRARVAVSYNFTFSSSAGDNSDLRFYADALAVTVP